MSDNREWDGWTRYTDGAAIRCPVTMSHPNPASAFERRQLARCGKRLPQRCGPQTVVWVRVAGPQPATSACPSTLEVCPRCGTVLEMRYLVATKAA